MRKMINAIWDYLTGYKNERLQSAKQIELLQGEKKQLIDDLNELEKEYSILHVSKNVLVADYANEKRDLNNQLKDLKLKNQLLQARLTVTS